MSTTDSHTLEEHFAVWADLVSFLLLCMAIVIHGGITPRRSVWGRSPARTALNALSMALNIIFSVGRCIAEGVLVETGPREFLLLSVIYSARWLWLYAKITNTDSRAARAFKVAQELRRLKTIRLGESTSPERKGEKELVIRRGARTANGTPYWRGVEEYVKLNERNRTYKVRLVEKELHADKLDVIGTVDFKKKLETESSDALYKKFYDLVMMSVDNRNNKLVSDYQSFLDAYGPVEASSHLAQQTGATDSTEKGMVARRVAADACYYIWNPTGQLRTAGQIDLINASIEEAASVYMGSSDLGLDALNREDSPNEHKESDCDCFGRTSTKGSYATAGAKLPV